MVIVSWMYSNIKTDQIIHFKYMKLVVCQLYFNKPVHTHKNACLWIKSWGRNVEEKKPKLIQISCLPVPIIVIFKPFWVCIVLLTSKLWKE